MGLVPSSFLNDGDLITPPPLLPPPELSSGPALAVLMVSVSIPRPRSRNSRNEGSLGSPEDLSTVEIVVISHIYEQHITAVHTSSIEQLYVVAVALVVYSSSTR